MLRTTPPAVILTGLVAAIALPADAAAQGQPPSPVRTAKVQERELRRYERVTGSLRAARQVLLAALEEGALVELRVREGARVKKGEVLAATDGRRLAAELTTAKADQVKLRAERDQRQAELENAQLDLTAIAAAAAEKAVSQRDLRNAKTKVLVAKATLAAVDGQIGALAGQIELLSVRRGDTVLRAPFDGVVVERHAEPGTWRQSGDPVLTLLSSGVIEAWFDVPERHAAALATVEKAEFQVLVRATGKRYSGTRSRILPRVHPTARTFPFLVDLKGEGLMAGMAVSAEIPVGPLAKRLLIPRDAIVRRSGSVYVFVATPSEGGHVARQVPIVERFTGPEGVAIAAGGSIAPGALVVVEGNERLSDGAPLTLIPTSAGADENGGKGTGNGKGKESEGSNGAESGKDDHGAGNGERGR